MEKILRHTEVTPGECYRYMFRYGVSRSRGIDGKQGIAIVIWKPGRSMPWLPLHEPGKFCYNTPSTDASTEFIPATLEEKEWLRRCIEAQKFVPKEKALVDSYDIFTCN